MAARQNIPAQLRLKEIQIQSLKGISNCTITFPADRKVTAIMGMNGSGKSRLFMPLPVVTNPGIKPQRKTTDFQISLLLTMITTGVTVALQPIFTQETWTIRATKFHLSPQQHRMIPLPKCMPKSVAGSQYMHDVQSRSRSIWVCKR